MKSATDRLAGMKVLVVEDDYFIATEMCRSFETEGVQILGPVGWIGDALALIARSDRIDGAVLDINLHDADVFPAADMLFERNVPFVFATGYDDAAIPEKYSEVPRCRKPVEPGNVLARLFG